MVFYNGKEKLEEEGELRLSDAFEEKLEPPNLELRVKVRNINMGNSKDLFEKCRAIRDYMIFVDKVRKYSQEKKLEEAVEQTIEECLQENVLADFLRKSKAEVKVVCIYAVSYTHLPVNLAALPSSPSSILWKLDASAVWPIVSPTLFTVALFAMFAPVSSLPSMVSSSKVN